MLASLLLLVLLAPRSDIDVDEAVVFYPTYGSLNTETNTWTLRIHGRVFELEEDSRWRRAAIRAFATGLGLSVEETEQREFQSRAREFLVDNERGQSVQIRLGEHIHTLSPSGANGHFTAEIQLDRAAVNKLKQNAGKLEVLSFEAVLDEDDEREFRGEIHLIGPAGVSVISDIDDTIKHTDVADRRELVRNLFVRPFEPVAGMADIYRAWADRGAAFHYVSGSPWQLYEPLREFCSTEKFPSGTLHLKRFRIADATAYQLFASQEQYKTAVIEQILRTYPDRKFILVGDSGQQDPEIYAAIAKRFPDQIHQILIRDVHTPPNPARLEEIFSDLPSNQWTIFHDPSSIAIDWP